MPGFGYGGRRFSGPGIRRGLRAPLLAAGGGGSAWDPSQLPNVKLWWRGDLGIALGTGGVNTWTDQVGGEVLTARVSTAAGRPDVVNRGGADALRFVSGSDLILSSFAAVSLSQPITWILVREFNTVAGTLYYLDGAPGASNPARNGMLFGAAGATRENLFAGSTLSAGPTPSGQQAVAGVFDGASSALYVDNLSTAASTGNAGAGVPTGLTVGTNNLDNLPFDGWLWEIIGIDGAYPSGSDLTSLGDYLSARYSGLSLTY